MQRVHWHGHLLGPAGMPMEPPDTDGTPRNAAGLKL